MKALIVEESAEVVERVRGAIISRWPECAFFVTRESAEGSGLVQEVSPDLVVLDLALNDGYGLDVLRFIRNSIKAFATPVLVISTRDDQLDRSQAIRYGANDHLTSPFSPGEIIACVERLLGCDQPPPPSRPAGRPPVDPAGKAVHVSKRQG